MADLKVHCPTCGQHLLVDDSGAGQTIECPECHSSMLIPEIDAAVEGLTPRRPPPLPTSPPAAAEIPDHHRRRPGLSAALVGGIAALGVLITALIVSGGILLLWSHRGRGRVPEPPKAAPPAARLIPAPNRATTAPRPSTATIQESAASGRINGTPLRVPQVFVSGDRLEFKPDPSDRSGQWIILFLFNQGRSPAGQSWTVPDRSLRSVPHVHIHWRDGNRATSRIFSRDYSLHLEFGNPVGNKLPGKIRFLAETPHQVEFEGTFEAEIQ